MTDKLTPPHRRRSKPAPLGHRGATSDASVLARSQPNVDAPNKAKAAEARATKKLTRLIRRVHNPLRQLTDAERSAIARRSQGFSPEHRTEIEEIIRLGLAMRESPAAASPPRPSKRRVQEVGISARATMKALQRLDAATQLALLASSFDADVSGVDRADFLHQVGVLLSAIAKGADKLAETIHSTPGAPPLAQYIFSTVELLAAVWTKTGRPTQQRNRRHPEQNITQSYSGGSFEQWLQDLLVADLNFATASEIHTAVGQVAGDATTALEQRDAGHDQA